MKVGDYVRFKDKRGNTYIRKVIDLPKDIRYGAIKIDIEANYSNMLSPKNNIKSSPNIIDLIEVGDYVNGHRVTNISKEQGKIIEIYLDTNDLFEQDIYKKEDIKSIVTREMFESMEYKVGELDEQ